MHKPDPTAEIEALMSRLMPPSISKSSEESMHAMIDGLAKNLPSQPVPQTSNRKVQVAGISAAAAAVLGVLGLSIWMNGHAPAGKIFQAQAAKPPSMTLLAESDHIQSMTDDGLYQDANGSVMRALRMNVLEENRLQDQLTGIIVHISQPREEILYMPVSAF
ncbi:MAG: hypothetical protein EAZ42_01110 [Verrucomicrobia bacterium]|nr:MAG: hypothetical protein EAZ42_01110 [Verrucomicrobiota bacterium]